MADSERRRSALAGLVSRVNSATGETGLTIAERAPMAMVQVDAWPDRSEDCLAAVEQVAGVRPDPTPCRAVTGNDGTAALWIGPERWLITEPERRDLYDALVQAVPATSGVVVDQGHGRVCLRLSGPALREVLAAGSSIDFDPRRPARAVGAGDCLGTAIGHMAVTAHFVDAGTVDLYVFRSYAVSFLEILQGIATQYGYRYVAAL